MTKQQMITAVIIAGSAIALCATMLTLGGTGVNCALMPWKC